MSTTYPQASQPAEAAGSQHSSTARRRHALLSLGLAAIIVAAALFIGGRQGFDQIGKGGINQSLLPKPGDEAPDFTAYDLAGNEVSLSDFRGKPVWLNFWGSWCPPCRAEMPDIQAAYTDLAPKGVVLLAVSLDEPPQDAALFAARNKTTFTVLTDQFRERTGQNYPIFNFPTHIFIDASGTVRYVVLSPLSTQRAIEYGERTIAASS